MIKKSKKSKEEKMIEDIKDRLSEGEELRDVAAHYGMSCRAICKLVAKIPEEDPSLSATLEPSDLDLGDPLEPSESDNLEFEYV